MKCCSCSKGCELLIHRNEHSEILVSGGACHRGEAYALKMIAAEEGQEDSGIYKAYVSVRNGYVGHLLVVSDKAIPKTYFSEIDKALKDKILEAPVKKGQLVHVGIENPETRIVAARSIKGRND